MAAEIKLTGALGAQAARVAAGQARTAGKPLEEVAAEVLKRDEQVRRSPGQCGAYADALISLSLADAMVLVDAARGMYLGSCGRWWVSPNEHR
jgi:hypothetical protein